MSEPKAPRLDERVLLLSPTAKDAAMTRQILSGVGVACESVDTVAALCDEVQRGAGAVLLTEHAFAIPDLPRFAQVLHGQPAWSDLPVVVLAGGGASSLVGRTAMQLLGNVTVLERPIQTASLASVLSTLIRSRRRQYQIREHVDQLDRAAERLRQSEARYRFVAERLNLIFRNITDYAIFTLDTDGYVTEWGEGAQRVKGWKAEEIIGQHVSTFYPPDVVAAGHVDRELEEVRTTGRAERESWRVRKGGELFWGNEIATAMRDEQGRLIGFTKITRDLTEAKRMRDALKESEERYRLILENAREYAIFMVDSQGRIVTWNSGAERIFGYTEAQIRGQDASILFTPEDRVKGDHQKELATAVAEGRVSDDRWQMRRGGELFFASGITTALRDADGTLRGFVKVCRDLTERQQIQEQRERLLEQEKVARLEAERAMTLRDEFLAVVSHELRTPLTAMLLWAKMLTTGAVKGSEQAEVFEIILRSAQSQQQLIEDLLDISRMMSGKLRLTLQDAAVAPIIRAAAETVQPMADARSIKVSVELEDEGARARVDPDRIQQVVWNLLNNAVKFTEKGGRVVARLRTQGETIYIEIQDTGRGISPEFLPHVFERFRQADATTTRAHGGLGLGLAITRQLVELHGGTIRAQSDGLGKGSIFSVELPMSDAAADVEASTNKTPANMKQAAFSASPILAGTRVLVVEDEAHTRSGIQWLLEQCAAEVTAVDSAAQAVASFREALSQRRFDVLISDIGMPFQNGYDLIRELRSLERQRGEATPTPAIALTAYARQEDRARAEAAGFQTHVPKPVEPTALVEAVTSLLHR